MHLFCISAGFEGKTVESINSKVFFEDGIPEDTIAKLREMGHDAHVLSGFEREKMGRGQVIQRIVDKSGRTVWAAGSDPRADGHAAAQI